MIDFYTYFPNNYYIDSNIDYRLLPYEKLGYVRMDNNSKTNHKAREYRKIFVNANCLCVKIVLHKNFVNKYNAFNQVALMYLEFIGEALPEVRKPVFEKQQEVVQEQVKIEDMDEIIQVKIKTLKGLQEDAIKIEDFDEAKKLKLNIERTILIGKKLMTLEIDKKQAIENEDFDNAKLIKKEIENLKSMINPPIPKEEEKKSEEEKQDVDVKKEAPDKETIEISEKQNQDK